MPGPFSKKTQPIQVKHPNDIELGMQIREAVSGIVGTAWSRFENISGSIQFAIQPVGDGSTLHEAYNFDWQTLEIVGSGIADRASPEDPTVEVKLGQTVKDKISGFQGIVTGRSTFMNGCVVMIVREKERTDGKEARTESLFHDRLEILDETPIVLKKPKVTKWGESKPTGGPITRAYRP